MDAGIITSLISTVGFPIVACAAMGWYIYHTNKGHLEQIEKLNTNHYEEMQRMVKAVENNTMAIQHLSDLISLRQEGEDADDQTRGQRVGSLYPTDSSQCDGVFR